VPLLGWLRKDLRHRLDTLLRVDRPVYEYVDHETVERLVKEHAASRRDHSSFLWRILVLDLWLVALRSNSVTVAAAQ
jgi:hypothetical protein